MYMGGWTFQAVYWIEINIVLEIERSNFLSNYGDGSDVSIPDIAAEMQVNSSTIQFQMVMR